MATEGTDRGLASASRGGEIGVSVVISTRNRSGWLPDCLRSLADQDSDTPFEVIVIDNASTDGTAEVLGRWCEQDPRFRTAREERIGLSAGKNKGILLARGATVLFTDDDVIVDRSWVSSYVGLFARRENDIVIAGGRIAPVPHDLGPWPPWFDEEASRDLAPLEHGRERTLAKGEYVWGANMAVPKVVFDRFGRWNEDVGNRGDDRESFEDAEFQDRVRAGGVEIWFCPGAAIQHRMDRSKITPRDIVRNAFNRGRNEYGVSDLTEWGDDPRSWPKRRALPGIVALSSHLLRWTWWTAVFRVSSGKGSFARCRREAYSSGWSLETLRGGRGRLFRLIARVTLVVRGAMFRSTSDQAWNPGATRVPSRTR